jgi:hypothetical protein
MMNFMKGMRSKSKRKRKMMANPIEKAERAMGRKGGRGRRGAGRRRR